MTMKLSFLTLVLALFSFGLSAQDATVDVAALKAEKAEKKAQIAALQGEADAILFKKQAEAQKKAEA